MYLIFAPAECKVHPPFHHPPSPSPPSTPSPSLSPSLSLSLSRPDGAATIDISVRRVLDAWGTWGRTLACMDDAMLELEPAVIGVHPLERNIG